VEKIRAFAHFASTTLASAKSSDSFIQRSLFFPPSSCPFHPMSSFLKKLTARNSTVSALMLFLRRQKKRRQERKGRVISIENKKNSTSTLPPPPPPSAQLSSTQNLAAWATAGAIAYIAWVRPEQRRAKEREEAKAQARLEAAASAPSLRRKGRGENDRASPTPDPQTGGLSVGNPKKQ